MFIDCYIHVWVQHLLDFANSMEGSLILRKALDYEETKQFNVTIRASVTFLIIDNLDINITITKMVTHK